MNKIKKGGIGLVNQTKPIEEENGIKKNGVMAFRGIQVVGVLAFVVGAMWQTADAFQLTIPQYLMLYGGMWAVISEAAIQLLKRKFRDG